VITESICFFEYSGGKNLWKDPASSLGGDFFSSASIASIAPIVSVPDWLSFLSRKACDDAVVIHLERVKFGREQLFKRNFTDGIEV
jgi:hypothetical protein